MLGETLTSHLTNPTTGTSRTLDRINQDDYSSEYLGRFVEDGYNIRLRVRHTKDAPVGGIRRERHAVVMTVEVLPTETVPRTVTRDIIFTIVNDPTDTDEYVTGAFAWLTELFTPTFIGKLVGWQS
nr:MAG: putative coat protein [Leviviridae sp.]